MDCELRKLERKAAAGDPEALEALRKARMRSGAYQWTEKQQKAAKAVLAQFAPAPINPLEQGARILLEEPEWNLARHIPPGNFEAWSGPCGWYSAHCYPRLKSWAERVLREST